MATRLSTATSSAKYHARGIILDLGETLPAPARRQPRLNHAGGLRGPAAEATRLSLPRDWSNTTVSPVSVLRRTVFFALWILMLN
jgi:hypothetical protein